MSKLQGVLRALLLTAVLFALAPLAFAVDGTVLINQATSVNGLPGCPHQGFPIVICQSGSYRLSGNLSVSDPALNGISIASENVTLDLNGFSIVGPVVCTGVPVSSCTSSSSIGITAGSYFTVANGTVRGFQEGVLTGNYSHVDKVNALNNSFTGIEVGADCSVTNSLASSNGYSGIIADSQSNVVTGNVAVNNHTFGIVGSSSTLIGNVANGNGGNGFVSTNATLSGNTANNNGEYGMSVVCPSSVVGNTLVGNGLGPLSTTSPGCVDSNNAH